MSALPLHYLPSGPAPRVTCVRSSNLRQPTSIQRGRSNLSCLSIVRLVDRAVLLRWCGSNPHGFELGPRVEGPGQDGLGDGREGVVHGEVSVCDRAGG